MENYNSLSILILAPLLLAVLSVLSPKALQRAYAVAGSLGVLLITLFQGANLLFSTTPEPEITQTIAWLPALGASLSLKLDATSVWFVAMNALVAVVAFSLNGPWYRKNPRLFSFFGFSLIAFLNGAFLSNDLVFFYIFYEAVFIPMIFMVGIWGTEAKASAVFKFFLMSLFGSVLMLVSMFYLVSLYHQQTGQYSSNVSEITQVITASKDMPQMFWCFLGFFLAFAIKVPLVPLHGWVKEVYTLAPMPATIWMSAILSKLGVFGFLRFVLPLFPGVGIDHQSALIWLAALSILYPAFLAIRSTDPKTLLAYSSISHLGFVMMGVFAFKKEGTNSAILLSVGHTLVSMALFYILHLLQERCADLNLSQRRGLAKQYPVLFVLTFLTVLGAVSLPGTVNFAGEFLVLLNAFSANQWGVAVGGLGVIFGALYMLKFYQQLGLGSPTQKGEGADIGMYDFAVLAALLTAILFLGFQPIWILKGGAS